MYHTCEALEENFSVIKAEYEAYRQKLANRKDWDDSDTTPGLGVNTERLQSSDSHHTCAQSQRMLHVGVA